MTQEKGEREREEKGNKYIFSYWQASEKKKKKKKKKKEEEENKDYIGSNRRWQHWLA